MLYLNAIFVTVPNDRYSVYLCYGTISGFKHFTDPIIIGNVDFEGLDIL